MHHSNLIVTLPSFCYAASHPTNLDLGTLQYIFSQVLALSVLIIIYKIYSREGLSTFLNPKHAYLLGLKKVLSPFMNPGLNI
jgi:hypothetical protein